VQRREVASLRLAAQSIQPGPDRHTADPAQTVRRLLAVQAQDFAGAKWSVGLRTPGATDAAIDASLAAGEIARSWPMRGTLHFVAPEDLGWMLSLTAERTIRSAAGRHRELGLTERDFGLARDAAVEHLSGGRALTRDELLARFVDAGVAVTGLRGIHLIQRLSQWRVLVYGPLAGKQHTFALLDDRVPNPRRLERDEALGEFAARYFAGHGPATVRDFAWWSSLTLADARRGLELARPGLDELDVDGTPLFLARDLVSADRAVHALPGFDEFLLGYQDRSAPLAADDAARVVPGKNGLFLPTIVVDGEVVGTWRRTVSAKTVTIESAPFGTLSARDASAFDAALERFAAFVGRTLVRA